MKENYRKRMQNERNMHANECKRKGIWSVTEVPETKKQLLAPFPSLFRVDLEYADFHKSQDAGKR